MARNPGCTVYIGNLDEKVSERVLYEILIQVGRVVDLHIPRDKETSRPKGYAFAEYETEEIAQYAVRLFSGLVRLHNKTLKFAISGQDKPSSNGNIPVTPKMNPIPLPKPPQLMRSSDTPVSQHRVVNGRIAGYGVSPNHSYDYHSQASSGEAGRGLSDATGIIITQDPAFSHLWLPSDEAAHFLGWLPRCNCCDLLNSRWTSCYLLRITLGLDASCLLAVALCAVNENYDSRCSGFVSTNLGVWRKSLHQ